MDNCLFCKIIAGEIPSTKVYEDDKVYAFRDIHPQAPVHVLIVPRKHMDNILECDADTATALTDAIRAIAAQEGVAESGFRVISNCGRDGAQSVNHLHVHLLGGTQLAEKMA
ncbi:MAG: histidine triad nucleotide-binding protein [Clostridia bacterium]|nr:histidine triad nucleotide-binding protein [Clostridia bacterium]